MALGDPYATPVEFKSYISVSSADLDLQIADSLTAASREIEKHCGRQFNSTTVPSLRTFEVRDSSVLLVDDFHTLEGLVIKTDDNQTLTTSDYRLEPLNGVVDGQPGWPYYRISASQGYRFPRYGSTTVEVTAQWGWATVPVAVKQACIALANENLKVIREAPFGVAGTDAFGLVRVRDNQRIRTMLQPYRRYDKAVA
ncbi:hypothetical protein [Micromonospora sp. DT62]|uniref:hypothetical protein n=1 Tax=Micromonospora sp. DT62 TaxID=3416521 RepID=UPI003CF5B306